MNTHQNAVKWPRVLPALASLFLGALLVCRADPATDALPELKKNFQTYCDAVHRHDASAAMALQSKALNQRRDLKNDANAMGFGQHFIPKRFDVVRVTGYGDMISLKLHGWFKPSTGGNDVDGETTVTFVQEGGGWKIDETSLNLNSFEKRPQAEVAKEQAARMEEARVLLAKMDPALRAELTQMLKRGEFGPAVNRCMEATKTQGNPLLPVKVVDLLREEIQKKSEK